MTAPKRPGYRFAHPGCELYLMLDKIPVPRSWPKGATRHCDPIGRIVADRLVDFVALIRPTACRFTGFAMSDTPSKSIDFIARIAIPILAFFGGMLVQYAIVDRTLAQQEFATATNIAVNEVAQKNDKLREWADMTIERYYAESKRGLEREKREKSLPLETENTFLVSRAIADVVCIYPKNAFDEPYGKFIIDTLDEHPERLRGMDLRILLARTVADYRMLRLQYEGSLKILKESCGFLLRR